MKRTLQLLAIFTLVATISSCTSTRQFGLAKHQSDKHASSGVQAYVPQQQTIPQESSPAPEMSPSGVSPDHSTTAKANPLRIFKKATSFTKSMMDNTIRRMEPKENITSQKDSGDMSTGKILLIVLIVVLLVLLLGVHGLGDLISLLVGILIVVLLVLLILWLLGMV